MTAAALLTEVTAAGIRLTINGDRLHVEAPAGHLTPDLRARIVMHKRGIMELLAMRDGLLRLAREVGVPDRIVIELPAAELRACIEQLPMWTDAKLQHQVLTFYLRSLAGLEPCLPGSLMARRCTLPEPAPSNGGCT